MAAPGKDVLMRRMLVLLVLLPAAAGCGAKESSFEGSDEALKDARTSRVEFRSVGEAGAPFGWIVTGSIDYANQRGEIVIEGKDDSRAMRALFIGRDTYLGTVLGGKTVWQKETLDVEEMGADRFLPGPGGMSPDRLIDVLVKSSKKVEQLGKEVVRGVDTIHYRAHLDAAKLGFSSDSYAHDELVVEAWVDDDGLVRRIRVPSGGESASASVVDLYDFGVPVDVKTPAAEDIVSEERFSQLAEKECRRAVPERPPAEYVPPPMCLMYSSSLESGIEEVSPTETTARTVTEP
jgi:hypothetical protein